MAGWVYTQGQTKRA